MVHSRCSVSGTSHYGRENILPTVTGNSGENFYQELKDPSFTLAPPLTFEFLILSFQNLLISSTKLEY